MITVREEEYKSDKILTTQEAIEKVNELRKEGKKIGVVSGSFDLIHPGHINFLLAAKKKCDILIISMATDSHNAKTREGNGRPIFSEKIRAFTVVQLKPVDFVVITGDSRGILLALKPDVYINGIDYAKKHVEGTDPELDIEETIVNECGGSLVFTDTEKLSTTELIRYIKEEIK